MNDRAIPAAANTATAPASAAADRRCGIDGCIRRAPTVTTPPTATIAAASTTRHGLDGRSRSIAMPAAIVVMPVRCQASEVRSAASDVSADIGDEHHHEREEPAQGGAEGEQHRHDRSWERLGGVHGALVALPAEERQRREHAAEEHQRDAECPSERLGLDLVEQLHGGEPAA